MSTKILRILMLALLMCGAGTMSAQSVKPSTNLPKHSYEVPYLKPELRELADRILDCKRDSLSKSSQAKANKLLFEMLKPLKDSANDLVALGVYFMDNTDPRDAEGWRQIPVWIAEHLEKTSQDRIDKKMALYRQKKEEAPDYATVDSVLYTLFTAEAYLYANKHDRAANQYQIVSGVDTTNFVALYMTALAARANQPTWTLEALEKIKRFYPDFYEADRMIADVYYERNTSLDETLTLESARDKAIEYYKAYFSVVPHNIDSVDIYDRTDFCKSCNKYLELLREKKKYEKVIAAFAEFFPMYKGMDKALHVDAYKENFMAKCEIFKKEDAAIKDITEGVSGTRDEINRIIPIGEQARAARKYMEEGLYNDTIFLYEELELAAELEERFQKIYGKSYDDYAYYGDSVNMNKALDLQWKAVDAAIAWHLKAVEKDSLRPEAHSALASLYDGKRQYEKYLAEQEFLYRLKKTPQITDTEALVTTYFYVINTGKDYVSTEVMSQFINRTMQICEEILRADDTNVKALCIVAALSMKDNTQIEEVPYNYYLKAFNSLHKYPYKKEKAYRNLLRTMSNYLFFCAVNAQPEDWALARKACKLREEMFPGEASTRDQIEYLKIMKEYK